MKTFQALATAALILGIVGCGGGNVQYFQVALQGSSTPTGTDCPGVANEIITDTGIDGVGTWAIYNAPNSQYLLDGAVTGQLLTGTLSGGTYTFSASIIVDDKEPSTETTLTIKTTVTLTPSGPGMTGSITTEQICSSGNGTNCGSGEITALCGDADGLCGASPSGSQDSKDFDCVAQASVVTTQITNVAPTHGVGAAASAANTNNGGNNGGNNNGGGNGGNNGGGGGFASGTWSGTATAVANGQTQTVTDSETVLNVGTSFDFTSYLPTVLTGCFLSFNITGTSATLGSPTPCVDSSDNAWQFNSGNASVSGTTMTVSLNGTVTPVGGTSETMSISETLTGP